MQPQMPVNPQATGSPAGPKPNQPQPKLVKGASNAS